MLKFKSYSGIYKPLRVVIINQTIQTYDCLQVFIKILGKLMCLVTLYTLLLLFPLAYYKNDDDYDDYGNLRMIKSSDFEL